MVSAFAFSEIFDKQTGATVRILPVGNLALANTCSICSLFRILRMLLYFMNLCAQRSIVT